VARGQGAGAGSAWHHRWCQRMMGMPDAKSVQRYVGEGAREGCVCLGGGGGRVVQMRRLIGRYVIAVNCTFLWQNQGLAAGPRPDARNPTP
jgi:hypothetical protein